MPALESIEMGDVNKESFNFENALLELRGVQGTEGSRLDLPSLKSLLFGQGAFHNCYHFVLESALFSSK